MSAVLLASAVVAAAPAHGRESGQSLAQQPSFQLPVLCDMARVCSIQNYFDHTPGSGRTDYACGRLSYDGHDGTDFRVPDIVAMRHGVAVVAAAGGTVVATRDAMPDISVKTLGKDAVRNREAGNGVVIDHGAGWQTQYSHLKLGSVRVRPGQSVKAGDVLGEIGMSGNAEFPHVEFVVRYNSVALDPFVGAAEFQDCKGDRAPLWSEATLAALPYRPTGPLAAGFASEQPNPTRAREGHYREAELPVMAPVLVLWAESFGVLKGDVERFEIIGPGQDRILRNERRIETDYVSWFSFGGLKRPASGWAEGQYQGTYTVTRAGKEILSMTRSVMLVKTQ
ncbi:MAG: M23 family metallopeptidase [Alphaproteobacteria bacterium]